MSLTSPQVSKQTTILLVIAAVVITGFVAVGANAILVSGPSVTSTTHTNTVVQTQFTTISEGTTTLTTIVVTTLHLVNATTTQTVTDTITPALVTVTTTIGSTSTVTG